MSSASVTQPTPSLPVVPIRSATHLPALHQVDFLNSQNATLRAEVLSKRDAVAHAARAQAALEASQDALSWSEEETAAARTELVEARQALDMARASQLAMQATSLRPCMTTVAAAEPIVPTQQASPW